MLDLVRRIGTDFGISIIMASHLLSEIERVCDHLVLIDAGRLVQSAPVATFTGETGVLAVEVDDDIDEMARRLTEGGLRAVRQGRLVLVAFEGSAAYDLIRDTAAEMNVGLVKVQQRRQSLEDLFRRNEGDDDAGS